MNVVSLTVLHYGADYLPWALRSVAPCVEALNVFYTPHPSHGHRSELEPPETRCDLVDALDALPAEAKAKVRWHETDFWDEGQQRDAALKVCAEARPDLVLVVDCDEVWHEAVLRAALDYVWNANSARNWLINFVHLWRSFDWACRDNNWPVRVIDLRHAGGTGYVPRELGEIYHLGYAVTDEILRYKMSCHGHKDEWRPNWYERKWLAWPPPADCHPTNSDGWWNPEPFAKERLPEFMQAHPFYGWGKIE